MKKIIFLFFLLAGMSFGQVTVAPITNPRVQFFNNSVPCAGCLLDTFAAGTTTPLATYSESTGTTPNANPVILGSDGSAVVYLTSASYKFRLRTALGVTIWTQDSVSWTTPLTTFAGLSDAGNFTQTQPTAATNVANQSSFSDCMNATYWTGSVSATDSWCLQDILGTGANPTSTFTLTHSGSSGAATFSIPANVSVVGLGTPKIDGACYLDGTTNATLAAAVTCAGSTGVIVIPPFAAPTLTGNVTIPVGVTLHFQGSSPGQITLGNFNLIINGPIEARPTQIFVYGGTGRVTLGVTAVAGQVRAEWFPGVDWCQQAQNADNSFAAIGGEYWVSQAMTTASCTTNISIAASHVLRAEAGFYSLGSFSFIPNGTGASVMCASWLTNFNYTGTGYAFDINTQTQNHMHDCQISLGTTAAGGIRLRNTGNSFETRAFIRDVYISAAVRTAGQIGVLFQADNALSANYHSEVEVQTQTIDIGARFVTLAGGFNQGPNANTLHIRTNGHTIAVDHMDGTDNRIDGTILGANGGGNGIGLRLCAAGNGGYGTANSVFGPFSFEQGSTGGASTSISVASAAGLLQGCGASVIIGQTNDGNQYVDANTPCTNLVLLNTQIAGCNRTIQTRGSFTVTKNDGTLPATFSNDTAGGLNFITNAGKQWNMLNSGGLVTPAGLGIDYNEGTQAGSASGFDICYGDSTAHNLRCSMNNAAYQNFPQSVDIATNYTNATTTFSTVTGMSWAILASVNYTLDCTFVGQGSATTAGPKFQLTGPASPTLVKLMVDGGTNTTAYANGVATGFSSANATLGTLGAGTTDFIWHVNASVVNGVNAGTLVLQAAANGAGTVTISGGSCQLQ